MTDAEYSKFLKDNVEPLQFIKSSKLKLERCPEHYLAPQDYYYVKVTDGYHKIKYLPTYKNYRSDIEKMRKKGLILVEKSDKLIIFKAEKQNEQLTLF
jgi:hypothetical protein